MFFFWFVVFIYLKDNALMFVILICFSWNRAAMLVCESIRQIRGQKIYSKNKMFVCRQGGRIANLKDCYNVASIILYHYDNHPTYRFMLICCLNYLSYYLSITFYDLSLLSILCLSFDDNIGSRENKIFQNQVCLCTVACLF